MTLAEHHHSPVWTCESLLLSQCWLGLGFALITLCYFRLIFLNFTYSTLE